MTDKQTDAPLRTDEEIWTVFYDAYRAEFANGEDDDADARGSMAGVRAVFEWARSETAPQVDMVRDGLLARYYAAYPHGRLGDEYRALKNAAPQATGETANPCGRSGPVESAPEAPAPKGTET